MSHVEGRDKLTVSTIGELANLPNMKECLLLSAENNGKKKVQKVA